MMKTEEYPHVRNRQFNIATMWEIRIQGETYQVPNRDRSKAVTQALNIHKEVTETSLPLTLLRKQVQTRVIPESDLVIGGL